MSDRKNKPREATWNRDESGGWTFTSDAARAGYDLAQFYQFDIYAPPRKQLAGTKRGLPAVYIKVANHRLDIPDFRSRCTQYFVLFVRKSLFLAHESVFVKLLRHVAETTESAVVGQIETRMGDLGDFESGDLTPFYLGEQTDELPQLSRMQLGWHEVNLDNFGAAGRRGAA